MPVGSREGLISVQDRLDRILSGRDQPEAFHGETENIVVDDGIRTGSQPLHIDPEDLLARGPHVHLKPWLPLFLLRDDQDQSAVLGLGGEGVGKGDGRTPGPRGGPGSRPIVTVILTGKAKKEGKARRGGKPTTDSWFGLLQKVQTLALRFTPRPDACQRSGRLSSYGQFPKGSSMDGLCGVKRAAPSSVIYMSSSNRTPNSPGM